MGTFKQKEQAHVSEKQVSSLDPSFPLLIERLRTPDRPERGRMHIGATLERSTEAQGEMQGRRRERQKRCLLCKAYARVENGSPLWSRRSAA